jgi:hypothetical protein
MNHIYRIKEPKEWGHLTFESEAEAERFIDRIRAIGVQMFAVIVIEREEVG